MNVRGPAVELELEQEPEQAPTSPEVLWARARRGGGTSGLGAGMVALRSAQVKTFGFSIVRRAVKAARI